jgi:hypothetical protein
MPSDSSSGEEEEEETNLGISNMLVSQEATTTQQTHHHDTLVASSETADPWKPPNSPSRQTEMDGEEKKDSDIGRSGTIDRQEMEARSSEIMQESITQDQNNKEPVLSSMGSSSGEEVPETQPTGQNGSRESTSDDGLETQQFFSSRPQVFDGQIDTTSGEHSRQQQKPSRGEHDISSRPRKRRNGLGSFIDQMLSEAASSRQQQQQQSRKKPARKPQLGGDSIRAWLKTFQ